jgi:hypothetical protein
MLTTHESLRRARYWITALRVFGKISQTRQYIDGIRRYDAEFLASDPQIGEAIANMQALARELNLLAAALAEKVQAKRMNGGAAKEEKRCGSATITGMNLSPNAG